MRLQINVRVYQPGDGIVLKVLRGRLDVHEVAVTAARALTLLVLASRG